MTPNKIKMRNHANGYLAMDYKDDINYFFTAILSRSCSFRELSFLGSFVTLNRKMT